MDYQRIFAQAIDRLHAEGRYRVFIDVLRNKGSYPSARCFAGHNGPKPIIVWCSNDYLAMGQHPDVIEAMEQALHDVGAGSGGTRNIAGNTHYHIDLEAELADLHGKQGALLFTSGYISNEAALSTLGKVLPGGSAYTYLPASVRRFPRPEALADLLAANGFDEVRFRRFAGGIVALHVGRAS